MFFKLEKAKKKFKLIVVPRQIKIQITKRINTLCPVLEFFVKKTKILDKISFFRVGVGEVSQKCTILTNSRTETKLGSNIDENFQKIDCLWK